MFSRTALYLLALFYTSLTRKQTSLIFSPPAFAASYYNRYPDESQDATEYYFSKAEHVYRYVYILSFKIFPCVLAQLR